MSVNVVEYSFDTEAAQKIRQAYADEEGVLIEVTAASSPSPIQVFAIPHNCLNWEAGEEHYTGHLQRQGEASKQSFFDCGKGKITVTEGSVMPAAQTGTAVC